jgi:3-methyladenine DNA glycosylase AlkD
MAHKTQSIDAGRIAAEIDARLRALPPHAKTAEVRAVRREFSKRLSKATPREIIQLAEKLLTSYGHRFVAYELVHHHRPALRCLRATELESLGQGIASWGAVDAFATYLSGPAWREHQVTDQLLHDWARAEDRWWRRAALVSTVPLNVKARGGVGDVPRTLQVCRLLVNDRDDMVVKAMSWALRELVQHDPDAVRGFLAEHEDALAARVKREVRNKLATGLKNPRRIQIKPASDVGGPMSPSDRG